MTRLLSALLTALLGCFLAAPAGCLRYQQAPQEEPGRSYLRLDGVELRYKDSGPPPEPADHGTPLLLVHGYGSSLETWELVLPALSQGRRCVAADLPGFGLSSKYEGDYGPDAQAAALLGLADQLGLERFDVAAHSYGSRVAMALAETHPERVRRLAITDGFLYADQLPWFFAWARVPALGELLYALFYDQQLDWRIPLSFHDRELVSHAMVQRAYEALRQPGTRAAALAVVRSLDMERAERGYAQLDKPTLLLWGREDTVTPLRYGQRLQQQLPQSRLEVLPFAGHFPMVEAHARYAELLRAFLDAPEAL